MSWSDACGDAVKEVFDGGGEAVREEDVFSCVSSDTLYDQMFYCIHHF